jgi:hypothetical protein
MSLRKFRHSLLSSVRRNNMDLIDRLREYASTRKGELAELITEAADALERQTCEDAVSRQATIDGGSGA